MKLFTSARSYGPTRRSTCLLLLGAAFLGANLPAATVEAKTRPAVSHPYEVRIPTDADLDRMDRADMARARLPVDQRGAYRSQKKVNQQVQGADRKLDREVQAIDQKVMRGICQSC